MKPKNSEEIKKLQLRFAGFYGISLVLIIIILSSFWGPLPAPTIKGKKIALTGNTSQEHQILLADELLHERLDQLQKLDLRYTILLTDSATGSGLKTIIETITASEEAFGRLIDSVYESGKNYSPDNMRKFENLATSFRTLLENRAYSHKRRNAVSSPGINSGNDQREMLTLKKDLSEKESQLEKLEKELKAAQNHKYSYPVSPDDKLKQENDFLKMALRSQVVETNSLKKTNEQLTIWLNQLQKPGIPKRPL